MNLPIFYINLDRDIQRRPYLETIRTAFADWHTSASCVVESSDDESKQSEALQRRTQPKAVLRLSSMEKKAAMPVALLMAAADKYRPRHGRLEDDVQLLKNFETALQAIAENWTSLGHDQAHGRSAEKKSTAVPT